jgi:hypothetical protein
MPIGYFSLQDNRVLSYHFHLRPPGYIFDLGALGKEYFPSHIFISPLCKIKKIEIVTINYKAHFIC